MKKAYLKVILLAPTGLAENQMEAILSLGKDPMSIETEQVGDFFEVSVSMEYKPSESLNKDVAFMDDILTEVKLQEAVVAAIQPLGLPYTLVDAVEEDKSISMAEMINGLTKERTLQHIWTLEKAAEKARSIGHWKPELYEVADAIRDLLPTIKKAFINS